MVRFADKRVAFVAGCMAVATVGMLGAGIVALLTGVPLNVAGLFLVTAIPCGFVTVSLTLVAIRGRDDLVSPAVADRAAGLGETAGLGKTAGSDKADETALRAETHGPDETLESDEPSEAVEGESGVRASPHS